MNVNQALEHFFGLLTFEEREQFESFDAPQKIQEFLDDIPYSTSQANRCPIRVLRDREAHCLDGALLPAFGMLFLSLLLTRFVAHSTRYRNPRSSLSSPSHLSPTI